MLLISRKRTREQVSKEYDQGSWHALAESRSWENFSSLEDFVSFANDSRTRVCWINDELVHVQTRDYYAFRLRELQQVMLHYANDSDSVAEIGCGYGMNLFSLSLLRHWKTLLGFDLSENGIRAAQTIAAHFRTQQLSFSKLDLTEGTEEGFRKLDGLTVFSYFCLEQLGQHNSAIIQRLLNARVKRVIHLETTFELLDKLSPLDWISCLYVKRMDYNRSLLTTLIRHEREGSLRILEARRLKFSPTLRNCPTLIVWEPA